MLLESTRLAAFGRCVMGPTPVYPFARQNLRQPFSSMSPGVGVAHMEDPKPPISSADERGGDGIVARFADLCKVVASDAVAILRQRRVVCCSGRQQRQGRRRRRGVMVATKESATVAVWVAATTEATAATWLGGSNKMLEKAAAR
ncbi:hypothetical protein GW17_00008286 [Ensete ventricosum]|nr:hypothetical protein GW17_00008286 [Ensete ventricosum]